MRVSGYSDVCKFGGGLDVSDGPDPTGIDSADRRRDRPVGCIRALVKTADPPPWT